MEEKKYWSLQKDKRTDKERNIFKPTGKKPRNNAITYLLSLGGVFLLSSFLMTYFTQSKLEACILSKYCFNSKDDVILYTLYVFLNIVIIVLAFLLAYLIGKKIGNLIKK